MKYTIKEVFDTLQGEGGRAGCRSVFVRFAGCNLWNGRVEDRAKGAGACSRWCDTDFFGGDKLGAEELLERMDREWPAGTTERWCVLTGGEPVLQIDDDLIRVLQHGGWKIAIETNGTRFVSALTMLDWVTVSPKLQMSGQVPFLEVLSGNELKVILPGSDDGWPEHALVSLAEEGNFEHWFVQPQDPIDPAKVDVTLLRRNDSRVQVYDLKHPLQRQYEKNVQHCLAFIKKHPRWRLSLQSHKLIDLR